MRRHITCETHLMRDQQHGPALFGQIPDVLEAVWIDVAQGRVDEARKLIDGLQETHPFDDRYAKVENIDWESCATILSAADKDRLLTAGW